MSPTKYISILIFHLILGIILHFIPFTSKIFGVIIFLYSIYFLIRSKNKDNEVLYISAYIISLEVFLRMTQGGISQEIGKYSIIIFSLIGIYFKGLNKGALTYFIIIILFIPSLLIGIQTLDFETNIRKAIVFNLLGPTSLCVASIYTFKREVNFEQIKNMFNYFAFPFTAILTYIILYVPTGNKEIFTNTASNFTTSGGFGPNQVSTILGLGIFIFFFQIILNSKKNILLLINSILFILCIYRGILTFSRGGVITGFAICLFLLIFIYFLLNSRARSKIILFLCTFFISGFFLWGYLVVQTDGLIEKRYANQGVNGEEKESQLSGRETLMETELEMFWNNPILGVGVGRNKEMREEMIGESAASHSEITRLLAEHGSIGLVVFLILLFTPISLYVNSKPRNIFMWSFYFFWLLTINHAAMRLAAPGFLYALSLIKINYTNENKNSLHR